MKRTKATASEAGQATGTPAAEALQKVFKTLADPTRVRILRLLEQEELIVGELMEILGMAQSRVSRHLAILREVGLLSDRREGTFVAYRLALPEEGPWTDAWALARSSLAGDPTAERDDTLLRRALAARKKRVDGGRNFFDQVGPEWDGLRMVFGDDLLRAQATTRLVPARLRVADIGTGTGVLALELAHLGLDVIGIDQSVGMLETAREKWRHVESNSTGRVEFKTGDAHALPLEDASVDAVFGHMVLHSLEAPEQAIAEMARVLRPGGRLILVDFLMHDHTWMQRELGLLWLGFDPEQLQTWIAKAGLSSLHIDHYESDAKRDLPASFVAVAQKQANGSADAPNAPATS